MHTINHPPQPSHSGLQTYFPESIPQYLAPVTVLGIDAQSTLPEREVRMAEQAPAPPVYQPAVMNPALLGMPMAPPRPFTGNCRDWVDFLRDFDRYDGDIQSLGRTMDGARIRLLYALLETSGKAAVDILRHEAEAQGKELTLAEVKTRLNTEFGVGGMNPRAQLRALVPELVGGRPSGPQWRSFAGRFRLLALRSPELSDEEKREHLLTRCVTADQARTIHEKDRARAERPWALIDAFKAYPTSEVRSWLQTSNVDFIRVETIHEGHKVQCASPPDLERLIQFHQAPVWDAQNQGKQETILVYKVETKLSPDEILNFVGTKLGVDEQVNDGRRTAQAMYGTAPHQAVHFAPSPRDNRHSRDGGRHRSVQVLEVPGTDGSSGDYEVRAVEGQEAKGVNKSAKGTTGAKGLNGADSGPRSDSGRSRSSTPPGVNARPNIGKGTPGAGGFRPHPGTVHPGHQPIPERCTPGYQPRSPEKWPLGGTARWAMGAPPRWPLAEPPKYHLVWRQGQGLTR